MLNRPLRTCLPPLMLVSPCYGVHIGRVTHRGSPRSRWFVGLSLIAVASCAPAERTASDSNRAAIVTASAPTGAASAPVAQPSVVVLGSAVLPAELPAALRATCDTAAGLLRASLSLDVRREDGTFGDSFRGTRRTGCRLTANGTFKALRDDAGPVSIVERTLAQHGWHGDLRYSADGPDGSDVGVRKLDKLCMILGRWDGGDDSDTTPRDTTGTDWYQVIVECARDVPANADAGVPDSIWGIAAAEGIDSGYAIAVRLQFPPYVEGDFDGDGIGDAAVWVEQRASGKEGVAVVQRGTRRVFVIAAGTQVGTCPDDLASADRFDVHHKGSYSLAIGDQPRAELRGDAVWVGRRDSTSVFFYKVGPIYACEVHAR